VTRKTDRSHGACFPALGWGGTSSLVFRFYVAPQPARQHPGPSHATGIFRVPPGRRRQWGSASVARSSAIGFALLSVQVPCTSTCTSTCTLFTQEIAIREDADSPHGRPTLRAALEASAPQHTASEMARVRY
jgi:hypothetical protein